MAITGADPDQQQRKAGVRLGALDLSFHGFDLRKYPLGSGAGNCRAHRVRIARGIARCANGPARDCSRADEAVREINLFAPRFGERGIALMGGDAEHFDPLRLRRTNANQNTFAHRGDPGEGFRRQELIDNYSLAVGRVVGIGKAAACEDRCTQSMEVAGQDNLEIDNLKLAGIGQGRFQAPSYGAESAI